MKTEQLELKNEPIKSSDKINEEMISKLKVGTISSPYLADHGFRDMVVLPGSYYIESVIALHKRVFGEIPASISNISFNRPLFVSEEVELSARITEGEMGSYEYSFFEKELSDDDKKYLSKIKVNADKAATDVLQAPGFDIEEYQRSSEHVISKEKFYDTLLENGNQYGNEFQKLLGLWLSKNEVLAKLSVSHWKSNDSTVALHAVFIDSITQVLLAFGLDCKQTFVLKSVEEIAINPSDIPETLWARAILTTEVPARAGDISGDITVFDNTGEVYLKFSGVSFTGIGIDEADSGEGIPLRIASTFTADLVEDSIKFWSSFLDLPANVKFAPYSQVFQQLLDKDSLFNRNRDGLNIILLDFEGWSKSEKPGDINVTKERMENIFKGKNRYFLPNKMEIVHLNKYETDYVYKEIFDDQIYLRHGISLNDSDTVIDIGANIGLFSLFINGSCNDPKIFAYEPSPVVYELLKANADAYGSDIHVFNFGVSDRIKTAEFTFYENSSVFSGFYSDIEEDKKAIQAVVRNMLREQEGVELTSLDEYVEQLTENRMQSKAWQVQMISVSDIIRENNLERVDILKIDAEKSEIDVLQGIAEEDWPKIKQIVIEIHDESRTALKKIEAILSLRGFTFTVEQDDLLDQSGLYNIYAVRYMPEAASKLQGSTNKKDIDTLKNNVEFFCNSLRLFMENSQVPLILGLCPVPPEMNSNTHLKEALEQAELMIINSVRDIPNIFSIGSQALLEHYTIDEYYDPETNRLGHIPYTQRFFSCLGTFIFRKFYNLRKRPYKVIALDCDNTIWKGVCGEDGPNGVQISAPYLQLQEFMVEQSKRGMLVCLCSKNNEEDVLEVFRQRNDMALRKEHLTSWCINWSSKCENLKALAKEMNLGLESFIFIDDNPIECAEMKGALPEVLTLNLPENPQDFQTFIKNIWAFDYVKVTEEDANRTRMYKENIERKQFRDKAVSLRGFLDGLKLKVGILTATEDLIPRISQLTYRTNQFNLTAIRRSEREVGKLLENKRINCLAANVSDRFGDYGLVGVLIYEENTDSFAIDTFLLSCRALGRGVEYYMLSFIAKQAVQCGKAFIAINYAKTAKNLPAYKFIEEVASKYRTEYSGRLIYNIPAEELVNLEYNPESHQDTVPEAAYESHHESLIHNDYRISVISEKMQRIGEEFYSIDAIQNSIEEYLKSKTKQVERDVAKPETELQGRLLDIWKKVLRKADVDINDKFIDIGGTSLKAVQIISLIRNEFNVQLSVTSLFECPTIRSLATKIMPSDNKEAVRVEGTQVFKRGAQRKNIQRKRRESV